MEDLTSLRDLLLGLETLLLDPVQRVRPDSIADHFAEEFREFGKSGRTYNKAEILEWLRTENLSNRKVAIENFEVTPLGDSAALVTYISVVEQVRALRSSIWLFRERQWQILFHQGTVCG
jgi:hypothetical protein